MVPSRGIQTPAAPTAGDHASADQLHFPLSDSDSHIIDQPSLPVMDSDTGSEDELGYLSDSTYEIISQSSIQASDSDDETLDTPHDTDDNDSIVDHETSTTSEISETDAESIAPPELPQEQDEPIEDQHLRTQPQVERLVYTPDGSEADELLSIPSLNTSTIRPSTLTSPTGSRSLEEWIQFQEPIKSVADGLFNLPKEADTEADQSADLGTLVYTLADHKLDPHLQSQTFRIMYHGDADVKDVIVQKITQALDYAVDTRPRDPEAFSLLASRGSSFVRMEVFECHCRRGQSFVPDSCQQFFESKEDMSLAIFVHPQIDTALPLASELEKQAVEDCATSCDLARRCRLPRFDLVKTLAPDMYRTMNIIPFGGVAVHRLANVTKIEQELPILASPTTMPMDLETFLDLDPDTLNRNLAKMFEYASVAKGSDTPWSLKITRTLDNLWEKLASICLEPRALNFMPNVTASSLQTLPTVSEIVAEVKTLYHDLLPTLSRIGLQLIVALFVCFVTVYFLPRKIGALDGTTQQMTPFEGCLAANHPIHQCLGMTFNRGEDVQDKDVPIVTTATPSSAALSTDHPEMSLSIVKNKALAAWLSRPKIVPPPEAAVPTKEWTILLTNDTRRQMLRSRLKLLHSVRVEVNTSRENQVMIFNPADNTIYLPTGQNKIQTSLSRADDHTVAIQLSQSARCEPHNISIQAFPNDQPRQVVYKFVVARDCELEFQQTMDHYVKMWNQFKSKASSKLPSIPRFSMEDIRGAFEQLRERLTPTTPVLPSGLSASTWEQDVERISAAWTAAREEMQTHMQKAQKRIQEQQQLRGWKCKGSKGFPTSRQAMKKARSRALRVKDRITDWNVRMHEKLAKKFDRRYMRYRY